jgi:hypothetical protein
MKKLIPPVLLVVLLLFIFSCSKKLPVCKVSDGLFQVLDLIYTPASAKNPETYTIVIRYQYEQERITCPINHKNAKEIWGRLEKGQWVRLYYNETYKLVYDNNAMLVEKRLMSSELFDIL